MSCRQLKRILLLRSRYLKKCVILRLLLIFLIACVIWTILQTARKHSEIAASTRQTEIDYIGHYLRVEYRLSALSSTYHHIHFTNTGQERIVGGNWEIFFNHAGGVTRQLLPEQFTLRHVNGWLYGIRLKTNSVLAPKESVALWSSVRLVNRYYAFPRWYVASNSTDIEPRVLRCTDSEELEFVEPRHDGWSPETRYDYANLSDMKMAPKLIVPTPVLLELVDSAKNIEITDEWRIMYHYSVSSEAKWLSALLNLPATEDKQESPDKSGPRQQSIYLFAGNIEQYFVNLTDRHLYLKESYRIICDNDTIVICGQTSTGVFNGIQSLISMLDSSAGSRTIPSVHVLDAPRFQYRGFMIDVARNFIDKQNVLKTLDMMAMYKMNRLHMHLADDQGWRLEVPDIPELTLIGSLRGHSISEWDNLFAYLGSGPFVNSTDNHGSGFYSADDYRDILHHAAQLHITVIPEIDLPGHSHAAIQSMRVKYKKFNVKTGKFQLSDPGDASVYFGVNDVTDSVVNPCLESTFAFIEHILKTLINLHKDIQPLTVFNLGGDEVPPAALTKSPACRQMLSLQTHQNAGLKTYILWPFSKLANMFGIPIFQNPSTRGLKQYCISRVSHMAANLGLSIQSWEDGLANHSELPPDVKTWHNDKVYVNTFLTPRQSNILTFANAGYKAIMSYASHFYLDNPHEPDFEEFGLSWAARYVDLRKVFESIVPSYQMNSHPYLQKFVCDMYNLGLCPALDKPDNIIGLQASLWTELVRTPAQLEYMVYPRLLAVAERAWHEPPWLSADNLQQLEVERLEDWANFINTVGYKELRRLERLGIRYRLPPPGVRFLNSQHMLVNSQIPGLTIVFSADAGKTWKELEPGSSQRMSNILLATRSLDGKRLSRVTRI